jgi:galactose mutarotase-like enzyme
MAISTIDNGVLRVSIDSLGAELSSLIDLDENELLWQGGEVWPRRAPVLFPIVGRMPNDELVHDGGIYSISQHGFARDQKFRVSHEDTNEVQFTLVDNAATLMHFPFPFRLDIRFSLEGSRLGVMTTVANTGTERFSASLGEHPGFAWPIVPGVAKEDHSLEFSADEPAPIRRLDDGLLLPDPQPTPVVGRTIRLNESLFAADAMIFDSLKSRSVRYSAPGAPSITVDFADFPLLGVWSKAPGEFLCIEPWFGMTAPLGFTGEYDAKPGQFSLAPGDVLSFAYGITVGLT